MSFSGFKQLIGIILILEVTSKAISYNSFFFKWKYWSSNRLHDLDKFLLMCSVSGQGEGGGDEEKRVRIHKQFYSFPYTHLILVTLL